MQRPGLNSAMFSMMADGREERRMRLSDYDSTSLRSIEVSDSFANTCIIKPSETPYISISQEKVGKTPERERSKDGRRGGRETTEGQGEGAI